jgi:hypothetical protein
MMRGRISVAKLNRFSANFSSALCNRGREPPYQSADVDEDIRMKGVTRMIRKLTVALAATVVVGTAALAPSAANATWYGHGWYGYSPYYNYYPVYKPGYFFHKPHFVYPYHFKRYGSWNYRYNHY